MKRLLALLGAIGLIAAAVLVRGVIDGDLGGDDSGGGASAASTSRFTIMCIDELRPVCESLAAADDKLDVRYATAQQTVETLAADDFEGSAAGFDAWLTVNPYPGMVNDRTKNALVPVLGEPSEVIARSPVTIVGWTDRLDALTGVCGGEVTWACISDHVGQPWTELGGQEAWGSLKPGQASPELSATGLLTINQVAATLHGSSDFASNDFDTFRSSFAHLEQGTGYTTPPRTPLDEMLSKGPSAFAFAGSIESADAVIHGSRWDNQLHLLYPEPMVTADVVLVPVEGARHAGEVPGLANSSGLRDTLVANGWRVPDRALPPSADPAVSIPDSDGLPRAGVVEALRKLWMDVT